MYFHHDPKSRPTISLHLLVVLAELRLSRECAREIVRGILNSEKEKDTRHSPLTRAVVQPRLRVRVGMQQHSAIVGEHASESLDVGPVQHSATAGD